jgi:3-mercaptopyruvate sulfurtransferase SseA
MTHTTLISVSDLAQHLDDPAFVIFDCRHELTNPEFGTAAYAQSHIPGARFAHLDRNLAAPLTGRNGRHPLPDPKVFAEWLSRMGVSNDNQVIGYDNAGGVYASRLWWMLRWIGHKNVAVLDGGWQGLDRSRTSCDGRGTHAAPREGHCQRARDSCGREVRAGQPAVAGHGAHRCARK